MRRIFLRCAGWLAMVPTLLFGQGQQIALKTTLVMDGTGKTVRNRVIVIEGGRIVRLASAVPAGAISYDLSGLTVSPGWIDTHSHILYHFDETGRPSGKDEPKVGAMLRGVENAVLTLNAGFTTIQSPGMDADKDLREALAREIIPGPRLLTSLQPLTESDGPPETLRELVHQRQAQGADFIKIFASKSIREGGTQTMTDAQLKAACGEAKGLSLRTMVHAHSAESAKAATLAGCTSIEHGAYVTDDVFALMAQQGTYYDPNIGVVLQNYLQNKTKYAGTGNFNEEGFAFMEKGISITRDTFRRALTHKELKIVFGTDATAGAHGNNAEEFIVRVRDGGQDPMAAIVSATGTAAQSMNLENEIGSIAEGKQADIIAMDGNPLEDITAVRRVVFVMKGGKVFEDLAHAAKRPRAVMGN